MSTVRSCWFFRNSLHKSQKKDTWMTAWVPFTQLRARLNGRRAVSKLDSSRMGSESVAFASAAARASTSAAASTSAGNDSISRPFIPLRVLGHRNLAQLAARRPAACSLQLAACNLQLATESLAASTPPLESEKGNPKWGKCTRPAK